LMGPTSTRNRRKKREGRVDQKAFHGGNGPVEKKEKE